VPKIRNLSDWVRQSGKLVPDFLPTKVILAGDFRYRSGERQVALGLFRSIRSNVGNVGGSVF
jgi:hypothetical protein